MKKDVAMKWADDLESGEYKQCTGRLYDGEGYCCLGVLCKTLGRNFYQEADGTWLLMGSDLVATLPEFIRKDSGIRSSTGKCQSGFFVVDNHLAPDLVTANDGLRADFKEIAELIRKHWEDL